VSLELDDFLVACERATAYRARRSGAGYLTRCPAHEDRRPSLSVSEGDRADVVAYCFAGCTFAEILVALQPEPSELRDDETHSRLPRLRLPTRPPEPLPSQDDLTRWQLELLTSHALERLEELRGWNLDAMVGCELGLDGDRVVFPILDEHLDLVNVLRYQPNPARRWGVKMRALRGRPRELFPPPEFIPDDDTLVLVEGEPDTVTGIALGLRAVGVPGVGTWKPEWTRRLRGRGVALLFDADEDGRRFTARVAPELEGAVRSLSVLDLAELEPGAKDLTEAVLARRARGEK